MSTLGELRLGKYMLHAPIICGSVIGKDLKMMRAGVSNAIKQGADAVELRIDGIRGQAGGDKLLDVKVPIILTNRPEREGGKFRGSEEKRVGLLLKGLAQPIACIDIELSTPEHLREKVVSGAKERGVSVIMSHHDFSATPSIDALVGVGKRLAGAGCDIAKIVTFAEEPRDALRVLDFLAEVQGEISVPVISFAMGEAGRLSRIAAPLLGSPIVYAAVGEATAPGQFDVATTGRLLRELIQKKEETVTR